VEVVRATLHDANFLAEAKKPMLTVEYDAPPKAKQKLSFLVPKKGQKLNGRNE
jgi:hypothetical protein